MDVRTALDEAGQSKSYHVVCRAGEHYVEARGLLLGDDLVVAIYGGTKPHIGAVAVAIPRPSLKNPAHNSATSSVLTLVGHKDDIIARREAERLASSLNRVVTVVAGVHIDEAQETDIAELLKASGECVRHLISHFSRVAKSD